MKAEESVPVLTLHLPRHREVGFRPDGEDLDDRTEQVALHTQASSPQSIGADRGQSTAHDSVARHGIQPVGKGISDRRCNCGCFGR